MEEIWMRCWDSVDESKVSSHNSPVEQLVTVTSISPRSDATEVQTAESMP